jgi:hypothetical protein
VRRQLELGIAEDEVEIPPELSEEGDAAIIEEGAAQRPF